MFKDVFKGFMNDPEQAGERGKNTKVIETFTRHGVPKKFPEGHPKAGMSEDIITSEGFILSTALSHEPISAGVVLSITLPL